MSQISLRTFVRRFVVALCIVVVLVTSAIAVGYAQAARKVAKVPKANIDPSVLLAGGNYLLIGSDTRAFVDSNADAQHFGSANQQTGQRSDTIMVAHVDKNHPAFLVSFPRDLWVDIPGMGGAKINAAFNAGPQRLIETIERDFNVPISHYLEVDFAGFRKIVNAIGHIPIYFPTPARDTKSGLSISKAGCKNLNGDQALAYVRSRYYQSYKNGTWSYDPLSDLGRIKRQQYFLRTLAQQTMHAATHAPWRASSIADAVLANLVRDPKLGLSQMRAFAYAFHKAGDIETLTLPTNRQFMNGQDALVLDDAKAAPILARLRTGAAPKKVKAPDIDPSTIRVAVQNGSGQSGLGAKVSSELGGIGLVIARAATNADSTDHATTEVEYASGAEQKAQYVLAALNGAGEVVAGSGDTNGADVVVIVGRDHAGVSDPRATPASSAAPKTASTAKRSTGGSTKRSTAKAAAVAPTVGC